jgi:hypothetical protein
MIRTQDHNFLVLFSTDSVDLNTGKVHGKVDIGLIRMDNSGRKDE